MEITPHRPTRRRTTHAFSLIEMLVVVIILGIALAIAIPLYTASQKDSRLKACKANMTAIHQAEEAYRVRNRAYTPSSATTEWSKITDSLGGPPKCPTNDTAYAVTVSGSTVTITCAGSHGASPTCVNGSFTGTGASEGTP